MNCLRHPSRHGSRRSSLCSIAAFSLLLLLVPACGRSTSAATGNTTLDSTPSPVASTIATRSVAVPGPQLTWQPATPPPAIDPIRDTVSRSIAPGNGDIAYVCVAPSNPGETTARIYVTRDRAQTWTRGADIAVGAQPNERFALTCDIAIDANNPATALIEEGWVEVGAGATISQFANYATFDFAAHLQKLAPSQPHPFIAGGQLASWQGNIYAFGTTQIPGGFQGLWVSTDQMRSWRRLTLPDGLVGTTFWLNPSSGALLLLAGGDSPYRSDDHGVTWTAISTLQGGWIIAAPQAGQPWHLCHTSIPTGEQVDTVSCTADGGQTWTSPQPEFVYSVAFNPKAGGFWVIGVASEFAVAVDGAVLAAGDRVYRLPVGASVWQDLGLVPDSTASNPRPPTRPTYYPAPAGGVLWLSVGSGWMVASYPTT